MSHTLDEIRDASERLTPSQVPVLSELADVVGVLLYLAEHGELPPEPEPPEAAVTAPTPPPESVPPIGPERPPASTSVPPPPPAPSSPPAPAEATGAGSEAQEVAQLERENTELRDQLTALQAQLADSHKTTVGPVEPIDTPPGVAPPPPPGATG